MLVKERWDPLLWFCFAGGIKKESRRMNTMNCDMDKKEGGRAVSI